MDAGAIHRAFLTLYDESADALFRHIYYRVHDRELATDLTQESFTRMWDYLAAGKPVDNERAFLFRTAHNLIIDHYRRKKESSLDALAESGFDPTGEGSSEVMAPAAGREVLAAIKMLEDDYQKVIVLRYVNDLSIGEIATLVGESENTVSVRIHRALKKMRAHLEHGTT